MVSDGAGFLTGQIIVLDGGLTIVSPLAGLEDPDSGSIRMASDTTIGYLPQDGIVHHARAGLVSRALPRRIRVGAAAEHLIAEHLQPIVNDGLSCHKGPVLHAGARNCARSRGHRESQSALLANS